MGDDGGKRWRNRGGGGGCGLGVGYFLAWLGALIYYTQQADGFWSVIVAILKSFVWPAFLVYELLKHVGA